MSAAQHGRDFRPVETCPRCGTPVACGYVAGTGDCWCGEFAPLPRDRLAELTRCLCPDCLLDAVVSSGLASRWPR